MLRYVACVWDKRNPVQQCEPSLLKRELLAQPRWRAVFDAPGLLVLGAGLDEKGPRGYALQDGAGVILGNIFRRGNACEPVLPTGAAVVESGGRCLIDHYHGEYIAFAYGEALGRTCVVQGPSAGRPAYRTHAGDAFVYFTELADVTGHLAMSLDLDWEYVACHMIAPIRQGRSTAIRSIAAMEGGDCDDIAEGRISTKSRWSPVDFARRRCDDLGECVRQTRETLNQSVQAWASCYETALVSLSGGLDSSLAALCWASTPARAGLTAATFYGHEPGTDERPFARLAAEAAGCRHIEFPMQQPVDLSAWNGAAASPRPGLYATLAQQRRMMELAREVGATAVVTGDGGDAGFYQPRDLRRAADYVYDMGLGRSTGKAIMDTALLTETSVWKVARTAMQGLRWRRRNNANYLLQGTKLRKLVSAPAREAFCRNVDRYSASYMLDAMDLPPAKFFHVWSVAQPMSCRSALAQWDDAVYINPYTDEIVKEFCLATPVYIHCREGWTRWLQRVAFADKLPSAIIERTAKGRPDSYVQSIADDNGPTIRERLLDGELVKRGILDRGIIESAFRGRRVHGNALDLLEAYSFEVWRDIVRATGFQPVAA